MFSIQLIRQASLRIGIGSVATNNAIIHKYNTTQTNTNKNTKNKRWYTSSTPLVVEEANSSGIQLEQYENNLQKIILNRPKSLNALDLPMIRFLYPRFKKWLEEDTQQLILMKGAGGKAFCAGGDIVSLYKARRDGKQEPLQTFFREEYQLDHMLATYPKPIVSFLNGITMGGGMGLTFNSKFRVATSNTLCAMPETGIGFFCDVGGSYFLSRMKGSLGVYLGLTGARLKSLDVFTSGIATHYVSEDDMEAIERDFCNDPKAHEHVEDILNQYHSNTVDGFNSSIDEEFIETHFSHNSVEEIVSSLQSDSSPNAVKTLKNLQKMSPTSLKVVFEQLKRGKEMDMAECFKMEYRISQVFMQNDDFFEGVRALLVDKDNSPQWKPAAIEHVSNDVVSSYFSMPPDIPELEL